MTKKIVVFLNYPFKTNENNIFNTLYLEASFSLVPPVEHLASFLSAKSYTRTEGDARVYGSAQRPGQGKQDTGKTISQSLVLQICTSKSVFRTHTRKQKKQSNWNDIVIETICDLSAYVNECTQRRDPALVEFHSLLHR